MGDDGPARKINARIEVILDSHGFTSCWAVELDGLESCLAGRLPWSSIALSVCAGRKELLPTLERGKTFNNNKGRNE